MGCGASQTLVEEIRIDQARLISKQLDLVEEVQRLRKEIMLERINSREMVQRRRRKEGDRRVTFTEEDVLEQVQQETRQETPGQLEICIEVAAGSTLRSCFADRKRNLSQFAARYAADIITDESSVSAEGDSKDGQVVEAAMDGSLLNASLRAAPPALHIPPPPASHPNSLLPPSPSPSGGKGRWNIFSPMQCDYHIPDGGEAGLAERRGKSFAVVTDGLPRVPTVPPRGHIPSPRSVGGVSAGQPSPPPVEAMACPNPPPVAVAVAATQSASATSLFPPLPDLPRLPSASLSVEMTRSP